MIHLYIILALGIYSEISGMTAKITSQDLKGILNQMNQMEAEIHITMTELQATKDELEATKTELQATKDQLASKTRDVAFQVFLNRNQNITQWIPVIFDHVHYNAGDGYNTTTGKFTAPVSGTYMFHVQAEIYKGNTAQGFTIYIVQSDSVISGGYAATTKESYDMTASTTAITYVTQGEQLFVEITHPAQVYASQKQQNHFSGALLSAH